MARPDEALPKAVFAALSENAAVKAALAGERPEMRIYDRVPTRYVLPYVTIDEVQIVDDTHCEAAWEAFVTTSTWSEKVGKGEVQRVGGAVGEALNAELTIPGFVCVVFQFQSARYFTEPDGLTAHGVLTHRYLIDPA